MLQKVTCAAVFKNLLHIIFYIWILAGTWDWAFYLLSKTVLGTEVAKKFL